MMKWALSVLAAALPAAFCPLELYAQEVVTPSALEEIVALYRQVVVLLDEAESIAEPARTDYVEAARTLYYRKQAALQRLSETLGSEIQSARSQAPPTEPEGVRRFMDFVNNPELLPADRLAFSDLMEEIVSMLGEDETTRGASEAPWSRSLRALDTDLESVRRDYDDEVPRERGGPGREQWRRYIERIRRGVSVEDILDEYRRSSAAHENETRGNRARDGRLWGTALPDKHVVLTFDDGPHGNYTEKVLAILREYEAPAYFFTVGGNLGSLTEEDQASLGRRAEIARLAHEAGHTLGNHTFSHPSLTDLSEADRKREIEQTSRLLAEITGTNPPVFRPPYGATSDKLLDLVRSEGMTEILWNVDSWDWGDPIPSSIAERVVARLEESKKGILLFHDIHKQTVAALPFILEELGRRGYRWSDLQGTAAPAPASGLEVERTDATEGVDVPAESEAPHYRDSWAVVIGINDYVHWPRLAYAVADADAISKLLTERFGFKPSNVFTLLDEEATRDNIVQVLGGTLADPNRVDREDRLLVFFAGHGATRRLASGGSLGYLIPVDAELETYQTRGISMTQLRDFSELIPAKHVYYIMDSCYSGIALTRGVGADGRSQSYVQEITRRSARQILTAGGADQTVADSGPGGHSVFTWTLLQGLQGLADMDGNGLVTASELGAFAAPIVSQFSKQTPAFGNLVGSEGGEFIFEMSYESLSEVSRELDAEAARLSDELENVRREAREKLALNLALSRKLEEGAGATTVTTEEAKIAQANRYHALGLQYVREKRYEEALSELEQALALNPDNPTIVNNYGFVLYKMGRYRESITWFEKTVSLDENRPVVYVNLGDAYTNLGEQEKAASCYRKYLELWPTSPRAEEIQKLLESLEK